MKLSKKEIIILVVVVASYQVLQFFCASFIFRYNTSFFGIKSGWEKATDVKLMMLSALVLFPATHILSKKWEHTSLVLFIFGCLILFFGCMILYSDTWSMRQEYSGWDRMGSTYIVNKTASHLFNYLLFLTATMHVSLSAIGRSKQFLLYIIPFSVYFIILISVANSAPSYLG
ncbi:MAG: hypothetical protein K0S32_1924 [Bacteroidetes bacterium]|jgi:hypothetical protein|nr:hypothetical protein [Bacteroidota bacterium]